MTPYLRATLVHELTHALQDQHFDINRFANESGSDESSAFRTLVEGDAQRIEQEYVRSLSPDDAAEYQKEQKAAQSGAKDAIKDVPKVMVSLFEAPYVLGEGLMETLLADGGSGRIDEAFGDPPTNEEHLLDPLTFLDDEPAADVPTPVLEAGDTELDSGDFGAISWYLMLAERLDPRQALAAVDGWGGDSYVVYDSGSRTCVRSAFRGDDETQAVEMEAALYAWMAKAPKDPNTVSRDVDTVTLDSCDRGSAASSGVNNLPDQALLLPFVRASIAAQVLTGGGTSEVARCVSQTVIDNLSDEAISDLTEGTMVKTVRDEISGLAPSAIKECVG